MVFTIPTLLPLNLWFKAAILCITWRNAFAFDVALHTQQLGDNKCYNFGWSLEPATWNSSFIHQVPPRLFLQRVWKPAQESTFPLTVVTHLNMVRLRQLEAQCFAWEGPMAAAVYLPVPQTQKGWFLDMQGVQTVAAAEQKLQQLHSRLEQQAATGCKMTIMLFWEPIADSNMTLLYPYNTIRNYAMVQAKTQLVVMLDVDLVPSASLNAEMRDPAKVQWLLDTCAQKNVVVLPAMEVAMPANKPQSRKEEAQMLRQLQQVCTQALKGDKQFVKQLWDEQTLRQFGVKEFARGHNATNYAHWWSASDPYNISYEWQYEPWFIVDRRLAWWYDVRFRAWYYDKALQLASMAWKAKFGIQVHPSAYIVHRPHRKIMENNYAAFRQILRYMKPRAGTAVIQILENTYSTHIDYRLEHCFIEMPWWGYPKGHPYHKTTSVTVGDTLVPQWV